MMLRRGKVNSEIEVPAAWVGPARPGLGAPGNKNNPQCKMSCVFLCESMGLG